ncbi:MAG TPA: YetF domain-containing protein [Mucilaginibacter sp.]
MELLKQVFGEGKDLSILQMSCRGIVIFIVALLLIRLSGRRSFGVRTALDNIVSISLGAILSRAVVGASDFAPVVITCFVIVLMHRLFGWFISTSKRFGKVTEGNKIKLYEDGRFLHSNMRRALVCEEDIMQGVRKSALTEDMDLIEKVYIERNGEISAIKKK